MVKKFILSLFIAFIGHGLFAQASSTLLPRQAFLDSIRGSEVQLLDIRTSKEFAEEGAFPHATNIDYTKGEAFYEEVTEKFDPSKPLYIHCKGGLKSGKAVDALKEMGYGEIYELKGGFDNFTEEMQEAIRNKN